MAASPEGTPEELPPDNAARVAIFDAMEDAVREGVSALTLDQLHQRVIGRLRVLVPRELYNAGEREYLQQKVDICMDAGLLTWADQDHVRVALTGTPPRVRFPDDVVHDYPAGLELARERLDADNAKLREASIDVGDLVPSVADRPNSAEFRALVESMREHGFLKQFSVFKHPDGVVTDGRARVRAAAEAGVDVEWFKPPAKRDRINAQRRDTPLHRVLLALDVNASRLMDEHVGRVHEAVAITTGRDWDDTAADLKLTQTWRRALAPPYTPRFQVRLLPYRPGGEPRVHVTADEKVLARSLVQAAGLAHHKVDALYDYVSFEIARSDQGGGPEARFAPKDELIAGIDRMLADRRRTKRTRKTEPEWDEIREWLRATFSENSDETSTEQTALTTPGAA